MTVLVKSSPRLQAAGFFRKNRGGRVSSTSEKAKTAPVLEGLPRKGSGSFQRLVRNVDCPLRVNSGGL